MKNKGETRMKELVELLKNGRVLVEGKASGSMNEESSKSREQAMEDLEEWTKIQMAQKGSLDVHGQENTQRKTRLTKKVRDDVPEYKWRKWLGEWEEETRITPSRSFKNQNCGFCKVFDGDKLLNVNVRGERV